MLKRKALIIGHPGKAGTETYFEEVLKDVENYSNYLQSLNGGAWEIENEIDTAVTKSKAEVKRKLCDLNKADYSIVIFAGHGSCDIYQQETKMEINDTEILSESDLYTKAKRQLIILDCCRVLPRTIKRKQESLMKCFSATESYRFDLREIYKMRFDRLLQNSAEGLVKIYACKVGEGAHNDISGDGGLFSYNFLEQCEGDIDLSVYKVFEKAKPVVVNKSGDKQHPCILRPRSGDSFPFYLS